jgi:hypothetical protein
LDVGPPQEVADLVVHQALNRAAAIQSAEFIVDIGIGIGIVPTVRGDRRDVCASGADVG